MADVSNIKVIKKCIYNEINLQHFSLADVHIHIIFLIKFIDLCIRCILSEAAWYIMIYDLIIGILYLISDASKRLIQIRQRILFLSLNIYQGLGLLTDPKKATQY